MQISKEVSLPLADEDKKTIKKIIKQLTYSQIEEYAEKYNLRPGMGLAFPQLGKLKRIIVIVYEYEKGKFKNYVFVTQPIRMGGSDIFDKWEVIRFKNTSPFFSKVLKKVFIYPI